MGEWVGRITNCFFYTVPFLEIEYPCAKFFFCLLYSTTVLKYDCIVGTVTEQLFYQCPLLRSCVPLKTEPLLNTNKIKPLVFIQMRHRALFIPGDVNCPPLLRVLNLQLSGLCELVAQLIGRLYYLIMDLYYKNVIVFLFSCNALCH